MKTPNFHIFYKNNFGASEATLTVVGDFDEELINKTVESHFGSWKSPSKYERIDDPYMEVKPEEVEINTPDKSNSMFFAGMPVKVNDSHEDYAAMMIGNYMLGGGFLNSRLATTW